MKASRGFQGFRVLGFQGFWVFFVVFRVFGVLRVLGGLAFGVIFLGLGVSGSSVFRVRTCSRGTNIVARGLETPRCGLEVLWVYRASDLGLGFRVQGLGFRV